VARMARDPHDSLVAGKVRNRLFVISALQEELTASDMTYRRCSYSPFLSQRFRLNI
jgi:hypothetical protein